MVNYSVRPDSMEESLREMSARAFSDSTEMKMRYKLGHWEQRWGMMCLK